MHFDLLTAMKNMKFHFGDNGTILLHQAGDVIRIRLSVPHSGTTANSEFKVTDDLEEMRFKFKNSIKDLKMLIGQLN